MNIRLATENDAESLLEIYAPYVEETAITFEYVVPTADEFRGRIRETLKNYPYYVAELDGKIAGYAYAGRFKERNAYDWAVETSIYVKQNILNANACIAQTDGPDEHLTNASIYFHEKQGYRMAGKFHSCGYKFNRWYNMVWMEKMLGDHKKNQPPFIPFQELKKITEIITEEICPL